MRRADRLLAFLLLSLPLAASAQDRAVVGHRVSSLGDESVLLLERADGSSTRIILREGALTVDGTAIAGPVTPAFRQAWDTALQNAWELDPEQLLSRLTRIAEASPALRDRLQELHAGPAPRPADAPGDTPPTPPTPPTPVAVPVPAPVPVPPAARRDAERFGLALEGDVRVGDVTIARDQTVEGDLTVLDGDVSVFGLIDGDLAVLNGDIILHREGEIDGDVMLRGGQVINQGGRIRGEVARLIHVRARQGSGTPFPRGPSLGTLLAFFVALAGMGFGLTFYLPKQLDVLTDTVRDSFGKSFLAGLFTQPLLLPALALGVLGLMITVVGILLIPIAVPVLLIALLAVATAGYLAVARAIGDHYVSRRLSRGLPTRATPYRSVLYGLCALLAVWLPSVLLGWIPVVGQMLTVAALVFTWVMVTAGLGAAILSQAGLRATLRKPGPSYLTDEHFWLPPARRP